jgi:hypothetical protein
MQFQCSLQHTVASRLIRLDVFLKYYLMTYIYMPYLSHERTQYTKNFGMICRYHKVADED